MPGKHKVKLIMWDCCFPFLLYNSPSGIWERRNFLPQMFHQFKSVRVGFDFRSELPAAGSEGCVGTGGAVPKLQPGTWRRARKNYNQGTGWPWRPTCVTVNTRNTETALESRRSSIAAEQLYLFTSSPDCRGRTVIFMVWFVWCGVC